MEFDILASDVYLFCCSSVWILTCVSFASLVSGALSIFLSEKHLIH